MSNQSQLYIYDFLYLGRKKMTSENEDVHPQFTDLVTPKFSYWTISYMITLAGAKKLCQTYFFDNIIPVDEYISYMINSNTKPILEKIYGKIKSTFPPIKALAFKNNLIAPMQGAFNNSNTFFSKSVTIYREDVILLTVGTDMNECVKRYIQSCQRFGFNPIILGLDHNWKGGDMSAGIGGGQKINFLKDYLKTFNDNKLLIFTDSYDVICNDHINLMIENYKLKYDRQIVFGAETSCWPDTSLADNYPIVDVKNKYLNSGNFNWMGRRY